MGGLGNGRRGGRTSSLMIAALVACILVLGFNYWVSSSHNLELQAKLYQLESQAQRGEAEQIALQVKKNDLETEIQRQKEQITFIESSYKAHAEEAEGLCYKEKAMLKHNISSSTQIIQHLRDQLYQLNIALEKFSSNLKKCEESISGLEDKCTSDLAQCQLQVQSEKDRCDAEAAAKAEPEVKTINPAPSALQDNVGTADGQSNKVDQKESKANKPQSDDIIGDAEDSDAPVDLKPATAVNQEDDEQPRKGYMGNDEQKKEEKDIKGLERMPTAKDPEMEEELLLEQNPLSKGLQALLEPADYDTDEQLADELDGNDQELDKLGGNLATEGAMADYDGDDENKGEFEADKQAELAQL